MAVEFSEPTESDQTPEPGDLQRTETQATARRIRFATQKATGAKAINKRHSILRRLSHRTKNQSPTSPRLDGADGEKTPDVEKQSPLPTAPDVPDHATPSGRRLFFNVPLPDDARDAEGHPLAQYPRNKIRTAKYTPLSFVPKNLWFQFQNIANVYFLFIIILGAFAIFGVENPGLAAVPLIVIVVITACKDAIEDWRRTVIDNELNNAPVRRLTGWKNVNTSEDSISLWRRFKKANTRIVTSVWGLYKQRKTPKGGKNYTDRALDRQSMDTYRSSMMSERHSMQGPPRLTDKDMEMTPVHTPVQSPSFSTDPEIEKALRPLDNPVRPSKYIGQSLEVPRSQAHESAPDILRRNYGTLINPHATAAGKARFTRETWKNVQVGDFVKLFNDEQVPADIVILSTSDSDGVCYVETKNLDGETNLKIRNALHCGQHIKRDRDCERAEFVLESEPPHANLYSYSGVVRWENQEAKVPDVESRQMAEPIGINNLLLRGCSVRNTKWILGIVVFTGEQTKIMLNSGITPSKRAKISKDLNWNVIYNFIILFCMCLIAGVVNGYTWGRGDQSLDFFEFGSYGSTPALNGFITFWAAVILFQNLVPISLYISLEIVRTVQAFFIYSDTFMYYARLDYPCTPKSWNISDDLGQIEYIFSDKTGTLTQNVMEFKKATVNGVPYGEAYTEALAGMQKRQGIDVEVEGAKAREQIARDRVTMLDLLRRASDNEYLHDDDLTFVAPDYVQDMMGEGGEEQQQATEYFMLALALCHTVLAERQPGDPPRMEFKAQSPDEAALVATAKDLGFTVLPSTSDNKILNVRGQKREYEILNILEFNSARKRMSVIARLPDGKIVLFCKGADSIIYSRLKAGEQAQLRKATAEHLEMFAREGLRTLCIAHRVLKPEEHAAWNNEYDLAAAAIQDRETKLELVSDKIERELSLLGGTAIEDRLQDGVPEAIALLAQAGIKLWVLTGDKVETAINIGFSCNLLDNDMELLVLKIDDGDAARAEAELDRNLAIFGKTGSDAELKLAKKDHNPPAPTHALVIDGDTLRLVLDDALKQKFLLLCKECKSVLCCRVSPAQKAAVVGMVKNGLDVITLAIGDGANDVAMIQQAHVGVGIAGEEGRQAVMSSDYAIGQFRFLSRLLLVHGRWAYRRLAETIANFFYKNMVWTFALFWYNIYDNFDCVYMFDYTYILLYNLAFTSLPIIFMGILDQDVDDKVSLAVPQLYRRGIERKEFTRRKFWFYMFDGVYQSLICFFLPFLLFTPDNSNTLSGRTTNDYRQFGVYIANAVVIVVNVYILLNTYRWDWFMLLMSSISILLIFLWTGIYTSFSTAQTFYGAARHVYGSLAFWALTLLVVIVCLLPRFAIKAVQKVYFPRDVDIVREQIRRGEYDHLKDLDPETAAVVDPDNTKMIESASSSDMSKTPGQQAGKQARPEPLHLGDEDSRPIYPPSVSGTDPPYSPKSSDGTMEYHNHRASLDRAFPMVGGSNPTSNPSQNRHMHSSSNASASGFPFHRTSSPAPGSDMPPSSHPMQYSQPTSPTSAVPPRLTKMNSQSSIRSDATDRIRHSHDRLRQSLELSRTRSCYEDLADDFTSAAYLSRIESRHSFASTGGAGYASASGAHAGGHGNGSGSGYVSGRGSPAFGTPMPTPSPGLTSGANKRHSNLRPS